MINSNVKETIMNDFRKSYRSLLRARAKRDYVKIIQEERLCLTLFHYCTMWVEREDLDSFIDKNKIDLMEI